jgi:DNA-binding NtrC family response regulator
VSDFDEDTITITGYEAIGTASDRDGESPRLIVVLDRRAPGQPGMRVSLAGLRSLEVARGSIRLMSHAPAGAATLFLIDHELSRQHARLVRAAGGWEIHDLGSKNGTLVNGESVRQAALRDGDVIEVGATLLVFRDDACGMSRDRDLSNEDDTHVAFRSVVPAVEACAGKLAKIARSTVPVLVRGETGTGKELVARAIHERSDRTGAFVPVNCGALPRTLIESELFGHRRGAFSGARDDHEGLVRRAHRGTLFLDEIAELPEESQVALLRVLQEGEVRPVGASDATRVDVRVVAATHQDLRTRIAEGRFRSDLYARLAGFEATLVPLRERREDIGTIISTLLPRLAGVVEDPARITFHRAAARALLEYAYPLNVRELEHALRSAAVLADGGEIRLEHLPEAIRAQRASGALSLGAEERELRERLVEVLRESNGNVMAAGRAMSRAPIQIRRWCRRLGVDVTGFRQSRRVMD